MLSLLFHYLLQFHFNYPFTERPLMFRHRKRLISKRLNRLMHYKTKNAMKVMFSNFMQSRSHQIHDLIPGEQQPQQTDYPIEEQSQSIESQQIQIEEEQGTQGSDGFSIADYVANLSVHQKRIFKEQNPELPETFFMTKKEKEKYFSLKAQKYQNLLRKTPDRKSKTVKKVQFKDKFAFKPFNEFQKVSEVKKAKESQSAYSSKIHFS